MIEPLPFHSTGVTESEKNADLALHILTHLERRRDSTDRIWHGDRHTRTLQLTCHVLDALHWIDLKDITGQLIEPAAEWLLDLPYKHDEESLPLRIFPSRFKTLALLGQADSRGLMSDFAELCDYFDSASGWIHDTPFSDLSPTLITMIWVDTLCLLGQSGKLDGGLEAGRERALQAIAASFETWAGKASEALGRGLSLPNGLGRGRRGEIANPGDASYAFDLLRRTGKLADGSPTADTARRVFTAAVSGYRPADMRRSDLLYCGIHLRTHFPDDAESRSAVEAFVAQVRERYVSGDYAREADYFHALVLRLLAAPRGERLRGDILEKLWQRHREAAEAAQKRAEEELRAEFADLVRQSIRVSLDTPRRITGTRARGEVYRLRFGLATEAAGQRGAPFSLPDDSLRLIVKKGPLEALTRAMERYRAMPASLQSLFALHAEVMRATDLATGYLVMQDLAEMKPLSEILGEQYSPALRRQDRERIAALANAVSRLLRALHAHERQPGVVSHQLNRIYLAPMVDSLNRIIQPNAFPQLKQWIEGTLEVNGWPYKKMDGYLRLVLQHENDLRPPSLSFAHGDCHSRNLMLNRDFTAAKFVDIDTLRSAEDYLVDYGLLLEDVAFYQSLPYKDEKGRVDWDEIQIGKPGREANALENRIAYPAFPQRSEAVVLFQRRLVERLAEYAESADDPTWKSRLWLATARGLLLLAERQLASRTVEPGRRADGLRLVQAAYAEAVRLLHELTEHLDAREKNPLPDLPFPGEHRAPPPRSASPVGQLIEALQAEFGDEIERKPHPDKPYFVDYFAGGRLLARIHTKSNAPALYLACAPDELHDEHHLAQPCEEGELRAFVVLSSATPTSALVAFVRQAFHTLR